MILAIGILVAALCVVIGLSDLFSANLLNSNVIDDVSFNIKVPM